LDEYQGVKLHSADYDESVSLKGRDVLLIGGGSSAVQILPAIQPVVKSVTIFIRSPVWVLPDISVEAGEFSAEQIKDFVEHPEKVLALRRENERTMNSIFSEYSLFSGCCCSSELMLTALASDVFEGYNLAAAVQKPPGVRDEETPSGRRAGETTHSRLRRRLQASHPLGLQIPQGSLSSSLPSYLPQTLSNSFQTLKKPNVTIVHGSVTSFTPTGCKTSNNTTHTGDAIICATGFDTSYIPRYPIIGPNGQNLQTIWSAQQDTAITGYMGVGIPSFPNTFTMLGPYTPVSNGPTLIAIEAQADYICAFIDRYTTEPIHSFAPKEQACEEFTAHVSSFMARHAVWSDKCRNSHNNHREVGGRTPTTWPGSTLHYLEAMREVRGDDWEVRYTGNRFSFLGVGVSQTEWEPTADLAYYIRDRDEGGSSMGRGTARRKNRTLGIARVGSLEPRVLHRQVKLAAASAVKNEVGNGLGDGVGDEVERVVEQVA
jgi:hypothetical protein